MGPFKIDVTAKMTISIPPSLPCHRENNRICNLKQWVVFVDLPPSLPWWRHFWTAQLMSNDFQIRHYGLQTHCKNSKRFVKRSWCWVSCTTTTSLSTSLVSVYPRSTWCSNWLWMIWNMLWKTNLWVEWWCSESFIRWEISVNLNKLSLCVSW